MKKLIPILLLCLFMLCSCGKTEDDGKINVVATMFPQYDFARNVAKEHANVEMLLPFGVDAHSYEPTPMDIIKIANADLFVYTGNEMEPWAKKLLESSDIKKAIDSGSLQILDLSAYEYITLLPMHEHEHEEGEEHGHGHGHEEYDTHIWTSTENAGKICGAIAYALGKIDEENTFKYNGNLLKLEYKFLPLENELEKLTEKHKGQTVYFGGSFAFRYLFDEIGINHVSIYEGCASHSEPSAADIAKMVSEIKASGAKYVLYENASEQKIAEAIAAECGIEVLKLHAIHNISKEEFDAGEDYFSLMQKNLESLGKALSE